jgi:hypothetical protein
MIEQAGRVMSSEYMHWAKLHSHARFNLATSGMQNFPLSELPVRVEDLEITGTSRYGFEPLQNALAKKSGVTPDCIVAAAGTSMANHLAMAGLVRPGDEVVIEHPTYELLLSAAQYLGAEVKRFARPAEDRYRVNPELVERAVSPRTRLIVITNLNNPTSELTDNDTLKQVGEIARRVGARVLVDEVYLDALFERTPPSAFHLGNEFVVTNSLTKVYGLSGLRCGWIVAEPELAQRLWRLNDLFGSVAAHPAELLSVLALDNLGRIGARARAILEANNRVLNEFYSTRKDLDAIPHEFGTTSFPRLGQGNVDEFCRLLREKYETSVVPGRFFEMPQHFRIGLGGETEALSEGLERLGRALDEWGRS